MNGITETKKYFLKIFFNLTYLVISECETIRKENLPFDDYVGIKE